MIPRSIIAFSKTDTYQKFLFGVFGYCKTFNGTIRNYQSLKDKMQGRVGEEVMLLERERDELTRLERELSYLYAEVLLAHTSKSVYKDQFFFETLIYLVSRVIKEFFPREEFIVVEEGTS